MEGWQEGREGEKDVLCNGRVRRWKLGKKAGRERGGKRVSQMVGMKRKKTFYAMAE